MAEIAVGGPLATDLFSLGADFKEQNSSNDDQATLAQAQGANGDNCANQLHGEMNVVTGNYIYTGATAFWPDTAGVVLMPRPGQIRNSWMITSVAIGYTQNNWPTVAVTGHNHDTNAHDTDLAVYSPSIALGAGFGCPDLLTNTAAATSQAVSESYTLAADHVEADNAVGDHFAGATLNGKETLSSEYVGTPTLTDTGWYLTSSPAGDSNTEFDTTSVSYEKPVTRDT